MRTQRSYTYSSGPNRPYPQLSGFRRNECKPLMCCGRQIGLVRDWVEKELVDFNEVFKISNDRIEINPELADYDSRSQVGQLDLDLVGPSHRDRIIHMYKRTA